jgi:hypothetical protein
LVNDIEEVNFYDEDKDDHKSEAVPSAMKFIKVRTVLRWGRA